MNNTGSVDDLILAIDQGGHASRAIVYDGQGVQVAGAHSPIATQRPAPGFVEHDADALDASVTDAVQRALDALGDEARRVRHAGLATQRSSIVCWDTQTGAALTPVISWQDLRAADTLRAVADRAAQVRRITGLRLSGHYGASKLRWCLDNVPAVRRARAAGTLAAGPLASFLLFRQLVEQPLATDSANASRTLLYDFRKSVWSDELLTIFGVPKEILPTPFPNAHRYGTLVASADKPVTLSVCTGDQTAALFATGRPEPGHVAINMGTGAFVQLVTAEPGGAPDSLLEGVAWRDEHGASVNVVEGTINGAGAAVANVAGRLGIDEAVLRREASAWLDGACEPPLFINGISGLAAPFWRPDARSRFVGDGDARARIVAVYESIVFLIQANLDAMSRLPGPPRTVTLSGGLSRLDPLCQRIADLSGLPVVRPAITEATARGLARLTAGFPATWADGGESARFAPLDNPALEHRYQRWRDTLDADMATWDDVAPGAPG